MGTDTSQLRSLAASQAAAASQASRLLHAAVQKSAFDLEAEMKAQIVAMDAVDTGALLGSVGTDLHLGGAQAEAVVGPTVDYAAYVHDGTYRMPGRPYAHNAADIIEPSFVAAVEQIGGLLT